jgi:hypothetical protein
MHLGAPWGPVWALARWLQLASSLMIVFVLCISTRRQSYAPLRRLTMGLAMLALGITVAIGVTAVVQSRNEPPPMAEALPIAAFAIGFLAVGVRRPSTWEQAVKCERCGYDLRGTLERERCPECGDSFDAQALAVDLKRVSGAPMSLRDWLRQRRFGIAVVAVLLALTVLPWLTWNAVARRQIHRRFSELRAAIDRGDADRVYDMTSPAFRNEHRDKQELLRWWSDYLYEPRGGCYVWGPSAALYVGPDDRVLYAGPVVRWVWQGDWYINDVDHYVD